jgi:prophage regulatory protein
MKRLIFRREVLRRVGLSYPTIWKMMREGRFPRSRVCGGKSAWLEEEIDTWIEGLPLRRLKGDAAKPQDDEIQKTVSEGD